MQQGEGSRGGKIIGHYRSGRAKYASDDKDPVDRSSHALVVGAVVGGSSAAIHINKDLEASAREAKTAVKKRNLKTFKKVLQPGDILVSGTSAKNASGFAFHDTVHMLPKSLHKPLKKFGRKLGLKPNSLLLSNATTLPIFGAGSKYHGAVYVGKGRVAHMSTDMGATTDKLSDFGRKDNVTVYRFKDAKAKEINAAVDYAKKAVKKKVAYQGFSEYAMNAFSNYVYPLKKVTSKKDAFNPLVCHTLPIRAYSKRSFPLGEHTFAGDFKHVKGLAAVATRDVVKARSTNIKALVGVGARGIKWGVAAGAATYALNRMMGKKEDGTE